MSEGCGRENLQSSDGNRTLCPDLQAGSLVDIQNSGPNYSRRVVKQRSEYHLCGSRIGERGSVVVKAKCYKP
jgi:hypothetical protein